MLRERNDHRHRPSRVGLPIRKVGHGSYGNSGGRCQMEKLSSVGKFHDFPLLQIHTVNDSRCRRPQMKNRDAAISDFAGRRHQRCL
jgi:hypothetical protein